MIDRPLCPPEVGTLKTVKPGDADPANSPASVMV